MAPISRILIANRGEIAVRVIRTCRSLGIFTIAVYSDADADAVHVRAADEAVRIGPAPAADSYLNLGAILRAAALTGAQAIHPGYGFLSENAGFAQAVADAGLVFVGPTPDNIRQVGSKIAAKQIALRAGVPVVPGYNGDAQDHSTLAGEALKIGFPVLLKASAGGGGRGMRIVRDEPSLLPAIETAKSEARNAFGDDALLVEKYIELPRHVEVQILGDAHGNVVHLFERECSIQRRHQKIIEESPSPALTPETRAQITHAGAAIGRAIGYRNAGTVEFIVAPDGQFYFLEVNTRLQVEHPVTELCTGLDLVALQIHVAEGHPLPFTQPQLAPTGAAVEVRLCAEDPARNYMPSTGPIVDWFLPPLDGVRVDTGVETGSIIGVHYDSMIAKIVAHGPDRECARRRVMHALRSLSVQGVRTNRDLLLRVLGHANYIAGRIDTHFLERNFADGLGDDASSPERETVALIAATLSAHAARRRTNAVLPDVPSGFRNNPSSEQWVEYDIAGRTVRVQYSDKGHGHFHFRTGDHGAQVSRVAVDGPDLRFEDGNGLLRSTRVVADGARFHVHSALGDLVLTEIPRFPERDDEETGGGCTAPMTGKIVRVLVADGDAVTRGQPLLVLEAMKMETPVTAPADGTIARVLVAPGDLVQGGQPLVRLG